MWYWGVKRKIVIAKQGSLPPHQTLHHNGKASFRAKPADTQSYLSTLYWKRMNFRWLWEVYLGDVTK